MPTGPNSNASSVDRAVLDAVRGSAARLGAGAAGSSVPRLVLAVSGGRDSMAMMHAFARVAPDAVAAVATFDHRTGAHAAEAVRHVAGVAAALGLRAISAAAATSEQHEAAWRRARWSFLRAAAGEERAVIATAHTRDDNVETVLIRALRGSGARGLAALYAPSEIVRPFVELSRDDVARDAVAHGVRWIEDPSNESRAHLRNRVRHDLLPALIAARSSLAGELLDIARRAAVIRRTLDDAAQTFVASSGNDGALSVATAPLARYDEEELRALWPAIAARGRLVLDRRGTAGLARFTRDAAIGDQLQLSGGVQVLRRRDAIVLRLPNVAAPEAAELGQRLEWGRWRFAARPGPQTRTSGGDAWSALLPAAAGLMVRAWRDGDRMHGAGDAGPRRVKRFLRDAGLVGPERRGWPVVVCGDDVVWIPGGRRSDAATVRSGRPEAVYVCERTES